MATLLTNREAQSFLEDVEQSSTIEFLEEGKEKDELIASAKKRGILIENSRDLGVIKTIYAFGNKANANGAILPRKEFKKKLPGLVGKLMDVGHNRQHIVGYYVDYKYIVKEDKAIAYAVFFKSAYPELWKQSKEFKEEGKLSSSFEIWSADDKTKKNDDGTYELKDMEMAGGALIFEDEDNQPAFKDAKVLNIAKRCVGDKCLHMSQKYNDGNLITAGDSKVEKAEEFKCECIDCGHTTTSDSHCKDIKCSKCGGTMRRAERPGPGQPSETSTTCANCGEEIELEKATRVKDYVKCPNCKHLLNKSGDVKYPAQNINFSLRCNNPDCGSSNWMIKVAEKKGLIVECLGCHKHYKLDFATKNGTKSALNFVAQRKVRCSQCGTPKVISGFSKANVKKQIMCDECGLEFEVKPVTSSSNQRIKKMAEIDSEAIDKLTKSSDKEGSKMKIPKEVDEKVKKAEEAEAEAEKAESAAEEVETEEEETKAEEAEDKTSKTEDAKEETSELYPNTKYLRELIKSRRELTKANATIRKSAKRTVKTRKELKETQSELETATSKRERYAEGVRKTVKRLISAMKDTSKLEKEIEEAKEFYKANAMKIVERRNKLGEKAEDLSDEDLLNDDKYETAKIKLENANLKSKLDTADEKVATKKDNKDDDFYADKRKKIDKEMEKYLPTKESKDE